MDNRNGNSGRRNSPLRKQILDTALHLFSQKGFFNTSIHDIQAASGVSMGSVYNYFAGKEAIAQALYDDLLERMEALVDDIVATRAGAHDQGLAIVQALFELTENEPEMTGFILNARHREFLRDVPPICSSKPFIKLRDIVSRGMAKGEIREMEPWLAASLTFGPALRLIVLRLDGLLGEPLQDKAQDLWKLTWGCIKP